MSVAAAPGLPLPPARRATPAASRTPRDPRCGKSSSFGTSTGNTGPVTPGRIVVQSRVPPPQNRPRAASYAVADYTVYTEEELSFTPVEEQMAETISKSGLFRRLCMKVFKECDTDKSGTVDRKELHVMLLLLYDKLNSKLPCHIKPPSKSDVNHLIGLHDKDGSGGLDQAEFLALARSLLLSKQHWKESLLMKVCLAVTVHMAFLPFIAFGFKSMMILAGAGFFKALPTAALAGGIGTAGRLGWTYLKEERRERASSNRTEEYAHLDSMPVGAEGAGGADQL